LEKKEPEKEEVRVSRTEIRLPLAEGGVEPTISITYFVKGLSPGLISIPKKEWTPEKEANLIREDIKKRRAAKPSIVRV